MDLFGESKKGEVVKYTLSKGVDESSIVNIQGLPKFQSCFVIDFSDFSVERFSILPCFDNMTYVFSYGHDMSQSRSTVSCLCFLGGVCNSMLDQFAMSTYNAFYDSMRLSSLGKKVDVQMLSNGKFSSGYLISMQVKAYNADLNAVVVTFTFMTTGE